VNAQTNNAGTLIDVNVSLGQWPLRRLPLDEPDRLVAHLAGLGVTEAWAGSFEALLHKDVAGVNARLAAACAEHPGMLRAFGCVNPALPDWEDDLRRCVEEHGMPGIRLHPNYHGYDLDGPECLRLLELAAARGLVIQLSVLLEDARMMHPLLRVPPVDVGVLPGVLAKAPPQRLVLLNAVGVATRPVLQALSRDHGVCVDIATCEGAGGVATLLGDLSHETVLFGTHAPLFYPESSLLKLMESALSVEQAEKLRHESAVRLFSA